MKRYIKAHYENYETVEDMFEELEYDLKNEVYSFYPDEEYMDVSVNFIKKNDSIYDIEVVTDYLDIDDSDKIEDELDNIISIVYNEELDVLDWFFFNWRTQNSFTAKIKLN